MKAEGIEIGRMGDGQTKSFETSGQALGVLMDPESDLVKAFRAVMDGIHRGEGGEEGLGGADVARGTVAADMLLPGLEGEAVGGTTGAVFGDSDQAAREEALVC